MRFTAVLFLASAACCLVSAQDVKTPVSPATSTANASLQAADKLYRDGKFLEASQQYDLLVNADAASVDARSGLVRSYLKLQMLKPAYDAAKSALEANPTSPALHNAMGEVLFRRGEMMESEAEFRQSVKLDNRNARAALGLARIYSAYSLHRKAYELIKTAHIIAPDDPEVQREWLRTLPRTQRIKAIQDYLKAPAGEDTEGKESLQLYLSFLMALAEHPNHGCEQATKVESTELELQPLLIDPTHLHGWGINVELNDKKVKLDLDTGASGFVLSRRMAEKANVQRVSDEKIGGIGDKGLVMSYTGYVSKLKIGDLEFHDCIVDVIDRRTVVEDDGLIGADVFSSYLVDIDFPGKKLKLSPLPKRPDEATSETVSLNTGGDKSGDESAAKEATEAKSADVLPKDRYVAPEMQHWSKVFRFGHMLLIPTQVNNVPSRLFLIDTGAFTNTLSTEFAREVTKISRDDDMRVKGISGYVENVYSAHKVALTFAHLRQNNEDTVTFDLSNISRHTGTEVSGIIGYATMSVLELKIDYRDGLVEFVYDPARSHTQNWRTK